MSTRNFMLSGLCAVVLCASNAFALPVEATSQTAPERRETETRRDPETRRGRPNPPAPDWPRAGGFGPGRSMGEGLMMESLVGDEFGRRELTDEDLQRAVEVAREVSPEWGDVIAARARENPEQMKVALRGGARRLLALAVLKQRAPKVFELKVIELRAQGETVRAANALEQVESDPNATEEARAEARAALDAQAAKEVVATIAAREAELEALESHLRRMREELNRDTDNADGLAAELAERARARGERRPRGSEGLGAGGRREGAEPTGPRPGRR